MVPPLLSWTPQRGWSEAQLGQLRDGVRFLLMHQPSCYRRGKWKLLIEVCGGEAHRLWGCFDDQDQPVRYYHNETCARQEAESLAQVLWKGRLEHPDPPAHQ